MTVSDLLEQLCNRSDSAIKLVTSCEQLVHYGNHRNIKCLELFFYLLIYKLYKYKI
jgi:hypothetical protein